MVMRTLSIGAVALAAAASVATAAGWTEQLLTGRMTVVSVDRAAGRFLCAEHGRWTATAGDDLKAVHTGDIVRVERARGGLARVTVLRTAADEIGSPE
jgi:nitrous oxidase accessory protein NosD